jgi:hypothetical protein
VPIDTGSKLKDVNNSSFHKFSLRKLLNSSLLNSKWQINLNTFSKSQPLYVW